MHVMSISRLLSLADRRVLMARLNFSGFRALLLSFVFKRIHRIPGQPLVKRSVHIPVYMALRTLGDYQRTVAIRIRNNLLSTQPSGSLCASTTATNKPAKSRILEMLDREMEPPLASSSPSPLSTPMKRVALLDIDKVATPSTTKT